MSLTRRSFAALAVSAVAAVALATAAAAHIIWEPGESYLPAGSSSLSYSFSTSAVGYSRSFPITITKPSSMTVTGPSTLVLPANKTSVTVNYTLTGATAGKQVYIEHSDANNSWGWFYYFQ